MCALEWKDVASWCGLVNTRILHLSLVLLFGFTTPAYIGIWAIAELRFHCFCNSPNELQV